MKINEKHLIVSAIKNGTVLDHIPASSIFKVIDILHLTQDNNQITIGSNLDSKSLGKKGIIKIADRFFADEEINKIALVAPQATINIIKNFEVIEKKIISIPENVNGIVKCVNPMCVTNHQDIETRFITISKGSDIQLLCHYCEKVTDSKNLKIISDK
ncbi:MAG: aspartate carbamoyltransferase regulatory subunit [Bacteroidales bacterium]|nr:aspartate carbamoyltransferase regulatory subunit [Bacteroidales bacterium]